MGQQFPPIATLADIEAIETVPLAERLDVDTTYALLSRAAEAHADLPAITFLLKGTPDETPTVWRYRDLMARVHRTANLLHDLGVGPGDAVSCLLPNLPQTHAVLWGGQAAGIVNPINPLLETEHIAGIMNAAETRVLVTLAPFPRTDLWPKVERLLSMVPTLRTVLTIDLAQFLPIHQRLLVGLARRRPRVPAGIQLMDFDRALAGQPADGLKSGRQIKGRDIAAYFHTGGTTGTPKLARHTHLGETYMAWLMPTLAGQSSGTVVLCGLPLFHVNAVIVTGLGPFSSGSNVVLATPAGYRTAGLLDSFWALIEKYRVEMFSGVPTIYAALLDKPTDGYDLSSLRFGICGAAPMPPEVFRRFQDVTGITILEGYGLTEGTCASAVNPVSGEKRIGSIGLRYPYQEMKTVVTDADGAYMRDATVDETGLIAIRGPNVFAGYKLAENNRGVFFPDGWLNTGDLGRMDAQGYFWLAGRAKDLIIRGGHNIDPNLIEDALARHHAVALAAAVGQPDAYAGEVPVAYVALRDGARATAEELKAYAREHIPERAAVPVRVEVVDDLPLTAVGKIFKPTLRARATEHALETALTEAGVTAAIRVDVDKTHGLLASVRLDDPAHRGDAEGVLGGFTVKSQIA